MSVVLFAQNLLESTTSVVTVSPAAATGKPVTRVFDRDRGPQYEGGSVAQTDLDIDFGAATAITGWALVNHTATGVTVTLFGDSFTPPTTSRDSIAATGVDFLRTFASLSLRYWRIRIPVMAVAPKIGELLLGNPRTISQNPFVRQSAVVVLANVQRDVSPGGYGWAARKGVKRVRLPYGWTSVSTADVQTLQTAFDEADQGAKNLLVQDVSGTLRWMAWVSQEVNPIPIGGGEFELTIELEESL